MNHGTDTTWTPPYDPVNSESGGGRSFHTVVGFDASPASYNALAFAIGWSRRVGTQLDVLHVPEISSQDAFANASLACIPASALPEPQPARDLQGVVTRELSGRVGSWSYAVCRGDPTTALENHALELRADAIIIGKPSGRVFGRGSIRLRRLIRVTNRVVVLVP